MFAVRNFRTAEHALGIAIVTGIAAIPAYLVGKKFEQLRILNPIMNSIALGAAVAAFQIKQKIDLNSSFVILFCMLLFSVFLINNFLIRTFIYHKTILVINGILALGGIIISFTNYKDNRELFSLMLFLSIIYLVFIIGQLSFATMGKHFWFNLSIVYFAAFIVVFLIIAFVISEGDVADGFDFGIGGEGKTKNKKRNDTHMFL